MHASVCDILLDITQNAVEANADTIAVQVENRENTLAVIIKDNGKGMDQATLERVTDPFFTDGEKHRHRRVGLGLPFLKQIADATDGTVDISSEKGKGTTVSFELRTNHIDMPPMGNLPGTVLSMMNFEGSYELTFSRTVDNKQYSATRSDLLDALDGMKTAGDLQLARQYLTGLEEDLKQE